MTDNLHDQVVTEIDHRKIKKLVDDGVISERDLAEADIIDLTGEEDDGQEIHPG